MKALTFILGAFSASFTVLGILFKVQQMPYAAILLSLGLGTCAVLFIPILTKYLYDKGK